MIPATNNELQQDFEFVELPTHTFKANPNTERIVGWVDGLEAMKQAIYLILSVERCEHLIHSWDYGIEMADLFGQPVSFIMPELKRRIAEALLQDSRITGVDNFEFKISKGVVHTTFTATTVFGNLQMEKVVRI